MSIIQTGDKEPVVVLIVDGTGTPLTGKTNIKIRVRRLSDGFYFDWSDNTFKTGGSVVTLLQALVEVSATLSPGEYQLNKVGHVNGFNTLTIINPIANDTYVVTAIQDSGTDAGNVPQIGEVKVGGFADSISTNLEPIVP